ncbi:unnamed protein product [Hymenolepis diminuta]|uniref:RF_PROK_I domain-containing protein n=1 Tax=Hymenolepis diminuta TaxID=6216 RepID=A0A0R3SPB8_HYMDI|nr:unnamed protein product [Hymenolepis diminuta]VUZ54524.1 unnamed protein product [Hymenolepis diminuta]
MLRYASRLLLPTTLIPHPRSLNHSVFFHSSAILSNTKDDKTPQIPIELKDGDLEETFIHGWGPGGQAINKTANCVRLKHIPTGITVKCQDGRNLQVNRLIARRRLIEHLDIHFNGEESERAQKKREAQLIENNRFSRAKRRLEMKAALKKKMLSGEESQ